MSKSADEVIQGALAHSYDPAKAHEYYLRVRELKGHQGGKVIPIKGHGGHAPKAAPPHKKKVSPQLQHQVDQLTARLHTLQARLRELLGNQKKAKKDDGHKSAAEKSKDARESKQYREKHKAEIASKSKHAAKKSGGGGHTSVGSMNETEVRAAIKRTRSNLQAAVAKARASANRGTA